MQHQSSLSIPNKPLILGHRGVRGDILENTLAGFRYAGQLQANGLAGVEFDVQLTADGQLVIFHDDNLWRLTKQQAQISQMNVSEVIRHQPQGHTIIALSQLVNANSHDDATTDADMVGKQLFTALSKFCHIELEVKTHARSHYAKLATALEGCLINTALSSLPLVLTSFDVQLLAHLHAHRTLSKLPRGLLIEKNQSNIDFDKLINTALRLGCCQVGVDYPLLNQAVITQCHRYGLSVSAWTVNEPEVAYQLSQWGVDVIITDYPYQFLSHQF